MSSSGPGPDDPWAQQNPDPSVPHYPAAPQFDYGAYAGGPGGPGGPPQVPMPPTVHWASIAMIVRTGFSIITVLIILARLDTIADDVVSRSGNIDRNAARAAVVLGAVIALIISVLLLGLAVMVRRGRNWARIVAIVLAALGILGGLFSYGQPYGGVITALDTVDLLLAIATLVLLVMPQSSEYFRARRSRPM
jgi:hypothetical protein